MRPLFKQVTIVGLGLIGGSLGMALKKRRIARRVIGFTRHEATLRRAKARGAIDDGDTELCPEWLGQSDLVVIATPPRAVPTVARQIARLSRGQLLLTDVASAKGQIHRQLARILPARISYVGSHPMAGSECSGIEAAQGDLFEGATCIVTPDAKRSGQAVARIEGLWRSVGSRVVRISAQRHDALVAQISHLPHLAAIGLVLSAHPRSLPLAAGGFSDATRIALSDPGLWRQILQMNRRQVTQSLDRFLLQMGELRDLLSSEDNPRLIRRLLAAQRKRRRLGGRGF